jgi:glycosyltransferase involved in cell wall biosynthesis
MQQNVEILMAVYNGERFIEAQLQSVVDQTYENWLLKIRDDGSTDKTMEIIGKFVEQFPGKILVITDNLHNIGSCNNFFELLKHSDSEYVMFADQDDVWDKDKVEKTLSRFVKLENQYGKSIPLLLHTNLKVVDENLNVIADSFWEFQQMEVERGNTLNKLLMQNIVTGCTTMINKALINKTMPLPDKLFVHDWWLALIAAAFGNIEVIAEPTLLYRQHSKNVAGAKQSGIIHFIGRLFKLEDVKKGLDNAIFQASVFLDQFRNELSDNQFKMLDIFSHLYQYNYLKRRYLLIKYGIIKSKFSRNIGLFLIA